MNIFVITSDFFDTGLFGSYTTLKRARIAIEHYFYEEPNIVSFKDIGDYTYEIHTKDGTVFYVEITSDCLDYEFTSGKLKEEEQTPPTTISDGR